jgi:hypothetical protein
MDSTRQEKIRELAYGFYEMYKAKGYPEDEKRDWARAEMIVNAHNKGEEKQYTMQEGGY